jgi:hypothetical protein
MTRRRFHRGSIYKRGKRKKVWVARFFEDVIAPDGAEDAGLLKIAHFGISWQGQCGFPQWPIRAIPTVTVRA